MTLCTKPDAGWHIDAGDEWRQPRVLDWSGQVVAVLPEESDRARLIAAAPDMLAALKAADDRLHAMGDYSHHPCRAEVRAAIARAEGRQP